MEHFVVTVERIDGETEIVKGVIEVEPAGGLLVLHKDPTTKTVYVTANIIKYSFKRGS